MTLNQPTEHILYNGLYFGYPQCCIDNFIHTYQRIKSRTDAQEKVHLSTGFVPCHEHALLILDGRTTLEALILPTRKDPKPFKGYREPSRSRVTKQQ
jgi:hypothetical protein